jgi:hypothetical protein
MSPEHPADESDGDEPHGATSPDEPGAPWEGGLTTADADADVSESGVEADHAGQDPMEVIVPEVGGEGTDGPPDRCAGEPLGVTPHDHAEA